MGKGSSLYAKKWTKKLRAIDSITMAKSKYPNIFSFLFEDGQWLVGVCSDSHASPWGGTIVIHDSKRNTHSFFGHVCGSEFLKMVVKSQAFEYKGPEEVYKYLLKNDFTEYTQNI